MLTATTRKSIAATLGGGLLLLLAAGIAGCGAEPEPAQPPPTGFAFFDIGANNTLTASVRKSLAAQLGSEAFTGRGIVDLEINHAGFLRSHFPELDRLNRVLNHPPMERVEHDITRLVFRYARQKGQPFHYVELVFSNESGRPLFFKVSSRTDGPAIVDQLRQKYGEPRTVAWERAEGSTLYWTENRDVLTISVAPNRLGEVEYQIAIYHVGNLEAMIAAEKKAAEMRAEELRRTGQKAF